MGRKTGRWPQGSRGLDDLSPFGTLVDSEVAKGPSATQVKTLARGSLPSQGQTGRSPHIHPTLSAKSASEPFSHTRVNGDSSSNPGLTHPRHLLFAGPDPADGTKLTMGGPGPAPEGLPSLGERRATRRGAGRPTAPHFWGSSCEWRRPQLPGVHRSQEQGLGPPTCGHAQQTLAWRALSPRPRSPAGPGLAPDPPTQRPPESHERTC